MDQVAGELSVEAAMPKTLQAFPGTYTHIFQLQRHPPPPPPSPSSQKKLLIYLMHICRRFANKKKNTHGAQRRCWRHLSKGWLLQLKEGHTVVNSHTPPPLQINSFTQMRRTRLTAGMNRRKSCKREMGCVWINICRNNPVAKY